jgi:GAF domain-containing protein
MRFAKKRRLPRRIDAETRGAGHEFERSLTGVGIIHENGQADASAEARAMVDTVKAVIAADSIPEIIRATLDTIRTSFGWAYASYWRVDEAQNALTFAFESGSVSPEFQRVTRSARFREGEGLNGRAWRQRDLVFVADLAELGDCCRAPVALSDGIRTGVCLPIIQDGRVLGTMDFFATTSVNLGEAQMEILRVLAKVASDKISQLSRQTALTRIMRMIENAPINLMYTDLDLKIQYMNPASVRTLKRLEAYLPVKVDDMIGKSIDMFHKNPEHQRRMLADPKNLPHSAVIQLGPESLNLLVSAIMDQNGTYLGPMLTWEVVTEQRAAQTRLDRIMRMIENAPINLMYTDLDLKIQYMNPASIRTLKRLEAYLPVKVDDMIGKSIDMFHKNPEHQRRMLADPKNLPHTAVIQLGPESLNLLVSAILDQNGKYLGPMLTWEVVTEQLASKKRETEMAEDTAALNQLLLALGRAKTAKEVVSSALTSIREAFGWPYGTYFEVDENEHALRFSQDSGTASDEFARISRDAKFREGEGLNGGAWRSRDLNMASDLSEVRGCSRSAAGARNGLISGASIPVSLNGSIVGTIDLFSGKKILHSENRLDTLRNAGRLVSTALERADQQARIDAAKRDLETKINALMKVTQVAAAGDLTVEVTGLGSDDMGRPWAVWARPWPR